MNSMAFVGAAMSAVIGAFIWGGITYFTNYEVGWVAWGIGGLIGFASAMFGGEGFTNGALCAILALLSIFGGKMLAVKFFVEKQISSEFTEEVTMELYKDQIKSAEKFAKLTSKDQYPQFMLQYGFTESENLAGITQQETQDFQEFEIPELRAFSDNPPPYSEWEKPFESYASGILGPSFLASSAMESLGLFDILFAFLGLITAFKIGSGMESEE